MQRILSYCARLSRPFKLSLLAILLILCMVWVQAKGGITEVLHLPATLDGSTPSEQRDFNLLVVRRCEAGGGMTGYGEETFSTPYGLMHFRVDRPWQAGTTILWIEPASLPPHDGYWSKPLFLAKGRSSTGDAFQLPCQIIYNSGYEAPVRSQVVQITSKSTNVGLLQVALPPLYPDTYRYIDVTVTDSSGKGACWRITRLPKTHRCISLAEQSENTVTKEGVTMHATAHRYAAHDDITFVAHLAVSQPEQQWGVSVGDVVSEWMPLNAALNEHPGMTGSSITLIPPVYSSKPSAPFKWEEGGVCGGQENPYRNATHFLRGVVAATKFDVCNEVVTFHDIGFSAVGDGRNAIVERAQTVTTPSGITLTIPVQDPSLDPTNADYGMSATKKRTVFLEVFVTPAVVYGNSVDLPASPLCRRYHKPVSIILCDKEAIRWGVSQDKWKLLEAQLAKAQTNKTVSSDLVDFNGSGYFNDDLHSQRIHLSIPVTLKEPIKDLMIIVRQRVDLRTVLFTLTAPIEDRNLPSIPVTLKQPTGLK